MSRRAGRPLYDLAHLMPDAHRGVFVLCFPSAERLFPGASNTRAGCSRKRKDTVYENRRNLNFEYKAGKLPDVDYASLRSSLQDDTTLLAEITRMEKRPARAIRSPRL